MMFCKDQSKKDSLDVFQIKFQGDFKKSIVGTNWILAQNRKKKSISLYAGGGDVSYDLPEVSEWMRKDWDTGP